MFNKDIFDEKIQKSKNFLVFGANKANSYEDLFLKNDLDYCILIEPLPLCVEFLKEKYKNDPRYEIYDVAISNTESIEKMITVKDLNDDLIGSSSLIKMVKNNIVSIIEKNSSVEEHTIFVKTTTINKLKNNFKIQQFDVIQIDTEGCDKIIFYQLIENNITFNIIKLETMWLNEIDKEKIHIELIKNNFNIYDDGCDLLAYRN
jgi:FkbM family methyltransferase